MDADTARRRLDEERARLEQVRDDQLQNDESQGANLAELSNMDQHQADVGTETFEREKDLSILENVEAELADIEHALSRLNDGTYGTCEVCGRPIDDDRLEAVPAARLCLEDQVAAERQARAGGLG
jgi:RNA polymerase-binding transcription factor DksA